MFILKHMCCILEEKEEKVHPFPLKISKNPYNY